jgi:hypothetical protein
VSEYRRPAIPLAIFRDEVGAAIQYGSRWGNESPPEERYSRTSNLERFLPLHSVARSLSEWLEATFEVSVEHDAAVASDLLRSPSDIVGAIRITPHDASSAPLTLILTSFPGIYLHAGALHDFQFPVCGCDACDDDVLGLADELEWTVRTVVAGGYSERFEPWPSRWISSKLDEPGAGMRGTRSRVQDFPAERVRAARSLIPASGQWTAWPEKT